MNNLGQILGNMAVGFIMTDDQGLITYMNKAAEDILGYKFDAALKEPFGQRFRFYNLLTGEKYFCPVKRALREDKSFEVFNDIGIFKDKQPVYLLADTSPMHDKDGRVTGTTTVCKDITGIRSMLQMEKTDQNYMKTVFEEAKIGICSLNIRTAVVDVNEAALDLLGVTYDEAQGQQLGDIVQCVNAVEAGCGKGENCAFCIIRNNLKAAVADEGYSSEFTSPIISVNSNEAIWLRFFLTQIWKNNNRQIVITMLDISERKKREKELQEARHMAEVASETKTQFLANMSHEIRTPINGMTGMINLTLQTQLSDEQKENLLAAKQCSEDLLRIINDILDFAKLENGKMNIETIDMDLHRLLRQISSLHGQVAENRGLRFSEPDYERLPRYIKGDPLRLRQILNNLLSNALKFTQHGSIGLKARILTRGVKSLLELCVEDTGTGISLESQKKLFQPFSQVDGSITRKFGGTGLGLMIVKDLVDAMNGDVRVVSQLGAGSKFIIILPLVEAEKADIELKDQAVFMNPYMYQNNKDASDEGTADLGSAPDNRKMDEDKVTSVDNLDDIQDLLKYCENKLQN